jgi:hypothetical protein
MKKPNLFRLAPGVRVMLERLARDRYTSMSAVVTEAIIKLYRAQFPEDPQSSPSTLGN